MHEDDVPLNHINKIAIDFHKTLHSLQAHSCQTISVLLREAFVTMRSFSRTLLLLLVAILSRNVVIGTQSKRVARKKLRSGALKYDYRELGYSMSFVYLGPKSYKSAKKSKKSSGSKKSVKSCKLSKSKSSKSNPAKCGKLLISES